MDMQRQRLRRTGTGLLAGIAALALMGCDMESGTELYLDDLVAVAEEGETLHTPTQIAMDMASVQPPLKRVKSNAPFCFG